MTSQAEDLMSGVNPRKNSKTGVICFQVEYFDGNLQNEQLNKRKVYSETLSDPHRTGTEKKSENQRSKKTPCKLIN